MISLPIEKLKNVIFLLRERRHISKDGVIKIKDLRKAILFECGFHRQTINNAIAKLEELEWLRRTDWEEWVIGDATV